MRSSYFLAVLPVLASATFAPGTLLSRQASVTCGSGDKVCGAFCIPSDYTCCPDEEGGCSATHVCQQGDNKEYGCCPTGLLCNGDGGAEFMDENSSNSTSTSGGSSSTNTRGGSTSTSTGGPASSTNGAQHLVLSQGLSLAVVAAGVAALL